MVLLLGLVALALFIWLSRRNAGREEKEIQAVQHEATGQPETENEKSNSKVKSLHPGEVQQQPQTRKAANVSDSESQVTQGGQYLVQQNVPIMLWGKIIDQDGGPIPDVRITMRARQWTLLTPTDVDAAFPKHETRTDANGNFEWTGVEGDAVELDLIEKAGYRPSPKTPHSLGLSGSSVENPVIFKMWKEGVKEPLVEGSKVFGIDADGRVYTLNLLDGKKVESAADGDLRVSIVRPRGVKYRDKYQWSFVIEGVGGGLLETDDEFMYLAPESGYKPKFETQLDPGDPAWAPLVKKQFFIRSRGGQVYGRIQVEVHAIYNVHSAIEINYAINPTGSRNLQP
jgi:hypothetical protein